MNSITLSNEHDMFSKDTNIICTQANRLLDSLYPSYLVNTENITELVECSSPELLDGFTYYRIASCSIEDTEDQIAFLNQKMEKLFTAIHSIGAPIAYGIISYDGVTNLVIGIYQKKDVDIVASIIGGLLSWVELINVKPNFMNKSVCPSYFGLLPAIPTTKIDDKPQTFDISPIMRSLNGQNYTVLFIAKPMPSDVPTKKLNELLTIRDQCFAVSKRNISKQKNKTTTESHTEGHNGSTTYSDSTNKNRGLNILLWSRGKSKTEGKSETKGYSYDDSISTAISEGETISGDIQNGFALELIDYAENGIERLKLGQSCGTWQTAITYSSDNIIARNIIEACLKGEISKPNPKLLPAKPISISQKNGQELLIPKGLLTDGINENPLCTLLTSAELALLCSLPVDSTPNFELKHRKQYPLITTYIDTDSIELGKLSDDDRVIDNMPFVLSEADLNKHTFVCGITGSGKTTTVKGILKNCSKPFMV